MPSVSACGEQVHRSIVSPHSYTEPPDAVMRPRRKYHCALAESSRYTGATHISVLLTRLPMPRG